jgi:hypothetical protein
MFTPSAQRTRPTQTRTLDPLEERFGQGHRLPLPLRKDLAALDVGFADWHAFSSHFSPAPSLRLQLTGAEPLRGGRFRFIAEMTHPAASGRGGDHEIVATGPVSACTQLLSRAGRGLEILTFRQVELHEATATFVLAHHPHHHERAMWAFGFGATPQTSIASAMSAAAQRIHG